MQKYLLIILVSLLIISGCANSHSSRAYKRASHSATSGKGSDFGLNFSLNPFQGRAKARLRHYKKKKKSFTKRRYNRKKFSKSKLSKKRMRSSGSRSKGRRSSGKKNKNIFNNRKK